MASIECGSLWFGPPTPLTLNHDLHGLAPKGLPRLPRPQQEAACVELLVRGRTLSGAGEDDDHDDDDDENGVRRSSAKPHRRAEVHKWKEDPRYMNIPWLGLSVK